MSSALRYAVACAIIAGGVFFLNLGGPKLWDRDEPRNAGCAREMMERQDWVTPYFNGELREHKPALLYWLMMSAYAVFGINEFSARFWSALLSLATVLMTFDLGRRWFHPRVGFWAGLMLSTCMMFPVAARAATPDAPLIFFATAALWLFALAEFGNFKQVETANTCKRRQILLLAAYAAMGLAVLAKGPIGLLLPAAIIFCYYFWQLPLTEHPEKVPASRWQQLWAAVRPRRIATIFRRMSLLSGMLVFLAVALPWYIWVGIRTDGAWLRGFFWTHNVNRFLEPMEGHRGPIFFYPLVFFACFYPWSFWIIPATPKLARLVRGREHPGDKIKFLLVWALMYIVFFSLAGTKLPSYITPSLPAFALMLAWWWDGWIGGREHLSHRSLVLLTSIYLVVGGIVLVGIPLAAQRFLPGEEVLGVLGAIWLVGGLVALLALRRGQRWGFAAALATAAVVFALAAFGGAAVRVSRHQQFAQIVTTIRELEPRPAVVAYDCLEPSWVFYLGRPIKFFPAADLDGLRNLLENEPLGCAITTRDRYLRIKEKLPSDVVPVAHVPYFLRDKELVLLGGADFVAALHKAQQPPNLPIRFAERHDLPAKR